MCTCLPGYDAGEWQQPWQRCTSLLGMMVVEAAPAVAHACAALTTMMTWRALPMAWSARFVVVQASADSTFRTG